MSGRISNTGIACLAGSWRGANRSAVNTPLSCRDTDQTDANRYFGEIWLYTQANRDLGDAEDTLEWNIAKIERLAVCRKAVIQLHFPRISQPMTEANLQITRCTFSVVTRYGFGLLSQVKKMCLH